MGACGAPEPGSADRSTPSREGQSHFKSSVAAYDKGDYQTAVTEASAAIAQDPSFAEAYDYRSCSREELGDLSGALEDAAKAIELNPRKASLYHHHGQLKVKQREYGVAVEDFTRAIERDPSDADYFVSRGCAKGFKLDVDGAIADFTRAIEVDPKNYLAWLNRGSLLVQSGNLASLEGALKDLDRAIELGPRAAEPLAFRAAAFLLKGDVGGALKEASAALKKDPRSLPALRVRAAVRVRQGNPLEAMRDYERVLKYAPPDWADREAVTVELQRLATVVSPADALLLSGWAAHKEKKYDQAMAEYAKAIALRPDHWEAYKLRADALREMGQAERAIEEYDQALKVNPDSESTYCGRGFAWLEGKDLSRADADFSKALAINGDHSLSHSGRAWVKNHRGDFDGALIEFRKALEVGGQNSDWAYAHKGCAMTQYSKGNYDEAIDEFTSALGLDPGDASSLAWRGAARLAKRDDRGALEDAERSLAADPTNLDALLVRGAARKASGDPGGAMKDYAEILTRAPKEWRWSSYVETSLHHWKRSADPKLSVSEAIAERVQKLSSTELGERCRAARELARSGPEAVPPLRKALETATGEPAKLLAGALARLEASVQDVAAWVNGEPITWNQVRASAGSMKPEAWTPDLLARHRKDVCEEAILWGMADRMGIEVSNAELDEEERRNVRDYGSREEFEKIVRIRYATLARYREERLYTLATWKLFRWVAQAPIPEPEFAHLRLSGGVSEDEARKYFESNRAQFAAIEKVSFMRIGMRFANANEEAEKREIAESLSRRLRKGAEFAMLAFFYSDVRRAKDFSDRGVSRQDLEGYYSPETIRYLFDAMKEGELSPIVKDGKTLNIFRMEQKLHQKEETFESAQLKIRNMLENKYREENRKTILAAILGAAKVEPPDVFEGSK